VIVSDVVLSDVILSGVEEQSDIVELSDDVELCDIKPDDVDEL
jgi:hypothetical protein